MSFSIVSSFLPKFSSFASFLLKHKRLLNSLSHIFPLSRAPEGVCHVWKLLLILICIDSSCAWLSLPVYWTLYLKITVEVIGSLKHYLPPGEISDCKARLLGTQEVIGHLSSSNSEVLWATHIRELVNSRSPLFSGGLKPKVEGELPGAPVLACHGFDTCSPSLKNSSASQLRTPNTPTAGAAQVFGSSLWLPALKVVYSLDVYVRLAHSFHQEGRLCAL